MSQRDDFDDHYGNEPEKSSSWPIVLLLLGGGLLLLIVVGVIGAGILTLRHEAAAVNARAEAHLEAQKVQAEAMRPDANVVRPSGKGDATRRIYSRDDFEKTLRGQRIAKVVAELGEPDEKLMMARDRSDPDKPAERWIYRDRVNNPATGKPFNRAAIILDRDGTVRGFEYSS